MARRSFLRSRSVAPNPLHRTDPPRTRGWAWLLLPVVVLGGWVALVLTPQFTIRSVEVTTTPSISSDRVRHFVEGQLQGTILGLPRGSQLLVSTSKVARSIRSALSGAVSLRTLSVHRRWPNALVVRVEEASGAYTLSSGSDVFLLDAAGTITGRVPGTGGGLLLSLSDPMGLGWVLGDTVLTSGRLTNLTLFVQTLSQQGIVVTGAVLPEVTCYPDFAANPSATNGNVNASDAQSCDRKMLVRLNPDLLLQTSEGWQLEVALDGDLGRSVSDTTTLLSQRFSTGRSSLHLLDVRIPGRAYYR